MAYVVGHFHISRKAFIEHFAFAAEEARVGFCQVAFDHKNGKVPTSATTISSDTSVVLAISSLTSSQKILLQ